MPKARTVEEASLPVSGPQRIRSTDLRRRPKRAGRDESDPDLLVFRSGGGLLALFGLPFLLTGLFVIALGRLILVSSHKRVSVSASSVGLRVEERAPLHSSVTEIPGHELEELGFSDVEVQLSRTRESRAAVPIQSAGSGAKQVAIPSMLRSTLHLFGRGGRITARSDRDDVSFGIGLSKAEAEYLVAVIKKALVG